MSYPETDEEFEYLKQLRTNMETQLSVINQTQEMLHGVDTLNMSNIPFLSEYKQIYNPVTLRMEVTILTKILSDLDKLLKSTCVHDYCEDDIDIDSETSKKITYCSKCMCTFSREPRFPCDPSY
jgi:hypothetical protein